SGWTIGRNIRVDIRWATANADEIRRHAAELAAVTPDVIVPHGTAPVGWLLQATRSTPIVFVAVSDPIGFGFVASLARPGGNATGRHPGCGAVAGGRARPGQPPQPRGDRARAPRIRAAAEWGFDRAGGAGLGVAARSDRRLGGPPQAAR